MSEKRGTPGCPFCGARSTFPGSMFAESYTCGTRRSVGDDDYHTGDKCDKACFRKCCIEKDEQLKQAQAEIASLREENERLRLAMGVEDHETVDSSGHGWVRVETPGGNLRRISPIDERVVELEEENERLRKDAERYEYLRRESRTTAIYKYVCGVRLLEIGDQLDAAIDAAKEAE